MLRRRALLRGTTPMFDPTFPDRVALPQPSSLSGVDAVVNLATMRKLWISRISAFHLAHLLWLALVGVWLFAWVVLG